MSGRKDSQELEKLDVGDAFDNSRIANYSDDALGVLGWKGTSVLLVILLLGFGIFKLILG